MSNKLQVCLLNWTSGIGGVERIIEAYAAGFQGKDCELTYAYSPFPNDRLHIQRIIGNGGRVIPLGPTPIVTSSKPQTQTPAPRKLLIKIWKSLFPSRLDLLVYLLRKTRRLSVTIAQGLQAPGLNPDICHLHAGYYDWLAGGVRACRHQFPQTKIVLHLHNPPAFYSPTFIERRTFRAADAVIFVSNHTRLAWETALGFKLDNAFVLPSPIILPTAPEVRSQRSDRKPVVLATIGRLSPIKGIDVAIRATANLIQSGSSVELWILGTGPEEQRLKSLATELKLGEAVKFMGFVNDPPALFGRIDFLLQPSLTTEGVPITVLEAMAAGLPVIATTVGGIPEVIENKVAGILIQPGSVEALASAIHDLIRDPGRAEALGRRARDRAVQTNSAPNATEALIRLYETLK